MKTSQWKIPPSNQRHKDAQVKRERKKRISSKNTIKENCKRKMLRIVSSGHAPFNLSVFIFSVSTHRCWIKFSSSSSMSFSWKKREKIFAHCDMRNVKLKSQFGCSCSMRWWQQNTEKVFPTSKILERSLSCQDKGKKKSLHTLCWAWNGNKMKELKENAPYGHYSCTLNLPNLSWLSRKAQMTIILNN